MLEIYVAVCILDKKLRSLLPAYTASEHLDLSRAAAQVKYNEILMEERVQAQNFI